VNKIFKGFALALSMLTTLPFFKVHDFYKGINGYGVMFYPLVGLFLGFILYGTSLFLEPYLPHFHLGIILFGLWVLLTGALHLDGLADTVDGLFVPKDRSLEVMKDPHNGGMGMFFGVTFLLLKASSLAALSSYALLPLTLLLSRWMVVLLIYFYPYISKGMGSLAKEEFTFNELLFASSYLLIIVWLYNGWSLLLCTLFIMFAIQKFFMKRYGGFTGDIYGFGIELTELILLNLLIIGFA
jgi:cobalamin 5'-phosphate synthase/cobalamin synthase